ncbi:MAG TPA: HEAT repeat domain-containing protein [Candidatus Bilamarchaeum sp.]|nr:HEAT repeat domain-containing protein [Candidatus Bilamarchaeum sp.]
MRKLSRAAPAVLAAHFAMMPLSEPMLKSNITNPPELTSMAHASRKQESGRLESVPSRTDVQAARLAEMRRALADPDPRVREAAAREFRSVRDGSAVLPLRRLLSDADSGVRIAASEALYNNGVRDGIGVLAGILGSGTPAERARAAAALGRIGESEAVPPLVAAAGTGDARVRLEAVQSLGMIGDSRAAGTLAGIMRHSGGALRRAAIRALGQMGTRDAEIERDLSRLLSSSDVTTRIAAANALRLCGGMGAVPGLIEAFDFSQRGSDPDQPGTDSPAAYGLRNEAVAAVVEISRREPAVIDALIRALGDRRENVRMNAAKALGRIGDVRAVPGLIDIVSRDGDEYARMAAAEALGNIGDVRALPALIDRVSGRGGSETGWRSIAAAAEALGRLRDGSAAPALRAALASESEVVRMAAATSLGILGDRPSVPALGRVLASDTYPSLRAAAALALGRIGGREAEAELRGSSDSNRSVRTAVERALSLARGRR